MQKVFADGAFDSTKCLWFNIVPVQGEGNLYWFAQTLLYFHVNLHGPNSEETEFVFLQYFDVTFPVDEIDKELYCVCLQRATDAGLDHSINFKTDNTKMIEAGEWYELVTFSSIVSVHYIVRSNYFVSPFSPRLR